MLDRVNNAVQPTPVEKAEFQLQMTYEATSRTTDDGSICCSTLVSSTRRLSLSFLVLL